MDMEYHYPKFRAALEAMIPILFHFSKSFDLSATTIRSH